MAVWFSLATLVAIAQLDRDPDLRHAVADVAPLQRGLCSLRGTGGRVPHVRGESLPALRGRLGAIRSTSRSTRPQRQNRWVTGFRIFLAIPAILLADSLMGFGTSFAGGSNVSSGGVAGTVAFLAWFACLARGRMPQGFRDLVAYSIGYSAQVTGYLLLLTDRYPDSDPAELRGGQRLPQRPDPRDDRRRPAALAPDRLLPLPARRSRTSFGSLLWGIAAFFAVIANWFATLVRGHFARRSAPLPGGVSPLPDPRLRFSPARRQPVPGLHRQGRAAIRSTSRSTARTPEPLDHRLPHRPGVSGLPRFGRSATAAFVAALLSWFYALVRGQVPKGLRNLGAFELRYSRR